MKDVSKVNCMFVDYGLFVETARVLGRVMNKVYYCNPSWLAPFPRMNSAMIGSGFDEIEVVLDIFEHFEKIDLFVFSDVGQGETQVFLESQGKAVWGCRRAQEMEFQRVLCKEAMLEVGLPVGPYEVVKGLDILRKHLKTYKDQFVKVDMWRGHFETFRAKNYNLVAPRIDEIEWQLGALKNSIELVCEDELKDKFEVAIDAYNIDGELPKKTLYGVEIKDLGYIGKFTDYSKILEPLKLFDEKMAPTFRDYGYRSFYSPETRIGKDKKPYMIDLCVRTPSPPNELYQLFYKNLPEIIWEGANGECIDPMPSAKWGAEILIHSSWATKNWQPIEFPKEYADNVKLRNAIKVDGKLYAMPQVGEICEIGAVVADGNTMEEAIGKAREIADSVEGYFVEIPEESLEKAQEEIAKAKDFGVWIE